MTKIATEWSRIKSVKPNIKAAIEGKGVTVPDTALIDAYPSYIDQIIPGSAETPLKDWMEGRLTDLYSDATSVRNVSMQGGSTNTLKTITLPNATSIGASAFTYNTGLTRVDLGAITSLLNLVFSGCSALTTLIIRTDRVCTLSNTNALQNTAIANGTGYIYVPNNLVVSYRAAANWATYASLIVSIDTLP